VSLQERESTPETNPWAWEGLELRRTNEEVSSKREALGSSPVRSPSPSELSLSKRLL
jgi:hypothetical protein